MFPSFITTGVKNSLKSISNPIPKFRNMTIVRIKIQNNAKRVSHNLFEKLSLHGIIHIAFILLKCKGHTF